MADQLRKDCLGCYGNRVIQTPNIDRIAAAGVRFERNIVQNPVCSPSRASILTGRFPQAHGLRTNGMALPGREVTLAEQLRRSGYRTGIFGKLHLEPQLAGPPARTKPGGRPYFGFETCHITEDPKAGEYLDYIDERYPKYSASVRKTNAGLPVEIHQSSWIADRTTDFIAGEGSERPFFAMCSFVDPHHGCDPPAPFSTMYDPAELPAPRRRAGEMRDKPPYFGEFAADWVRGSGGLDSSEQSVRAFAAQYYGEISLLDGQIGRVMRRLAEVGELENTIIAFTSDHGELLGDHGLLEKGPFLYDPLINTPFLLSWPRALASGAMVNGLTQEIDIAPTLLALAGVEPPAAMQGVSLVPLCRGEVKQVRTATLTEAIDPGGQPFKSQRFAASLETLRTEDWKLTFHRGREWGEMYDLRNDPDEFVNLWNDLGYRTRRQELTGQLVEALLGAVEPLAERRFDY